ncbi:MAG: cation:proton antiporter [Bacteroidaceae bacterium]|nr:cation:proton antiporter [Bacteroidaceae bacterium]
MPTSLPITDPTWIFFVVLSIILIAPMLLERLRIPSIVGMIFAGVLIGPHCFHVLERDSSFELFGKVGMYYIMFLASLEMNLQDVQKTRTKALTLGILSFLFPISIGVAANYALLHYTLPACILMGAMYASHTLISYPIVMRHGLSRHNSVGIAVGGTIVADVLTLLVLAVVGGMFKEEATGWFWVRLVVEVILIGLVIIYTFPLICRMFFRRYGESVVQYVFVLALVFLGAGLMEIVGIEGILGAFLVGIVLNRQIPPVSPLMSHIEFVGNALFIPYFLIGVGMLIDLEALTKLNALIVSGVMVVVALLTKWLAAFATQKIFKMTASERSLIYGLTNSRAAATLAIVLVGYGIILPDGSRLLNEDVLNGAMILILVTCIVSSIVTENTARHLLLTKKETSEQTKHEADKILIALSNPDTVAPLVNAALMLRRGGAKEPLAALNIVLDNDEQRRQEGLKQLDFAARIAAAANVELQTRSRWSVNIVTGIYHTMMENQCSDLLLGLHQKSRLTEPYLGKMTSDLINSIRRQVMIYRAHIPLNTVSRIQLVVPRKAEFEPGFELWAHRVAQLASHVSCDVEAYSGKGTLAELQAAWNRQKCSVKMVQHEYREWHDFISVANNTKSDHLVIFIVSRKGTLSRHNYMDHLEDQIERYFSSRSMMLIYPEQL